jgi:hypothetical protein
VSLYSPREKIQVPPARLLFRFASFKAAAARSARTRAHRMFTARRAAFVRSFADMPAARASPPLRPIAESTSFDSFARAFPPLLRIRVAESIWTEYPSSNFLAS